MVKSIPIQNYIIEHLDEWEERRFVADTIIFYAEHIPLYAFIISEGSGILVSKGRKQEVLHQNTPYCVQELLNNQPLKKNVIIRAGSTILIVDRFALMNIAK